MQSEANKICSRLLSMTARNFDVLSIRCGVSSKTLRRIINDESYVPMQQTLDKLIKSEDMIVQRWKEWQNMYDKKIGDLAF